MKIARLLLPLAALVLGCQKSPRPQDEPALAASAPPARSADAAVAPPAPSGEACVDAWLTKRGLDRFGHPGGTMYAGGTPLFDERTGVSTDRMRYVFARHPELYAVCPSAAPPDAGGREAPPALR